MIYIITVWWLLRVCNCLKGGTGEGIRLLGGSCLGYLFPEGLGQTALQELSACPELLIVLGVFRALVAALVKDGNHCRDLPSSFLLALRGHFRACEDENTASLVGLQKEKGWTVNGDLKRERLPGTALVSLAFPRTSFKLRKDFWVLLFSGAV